MTQAPKFEAGTVVAPHYEIVRPLAEGGMGAVYVARHRVTGRPVALKVAIKGSHDARLRDEARALKAVRHPGIVALHDEGDLECGGAYIALELVTGGSLARRLRNGPMETLAALRVLKPLAVALDHVHACGVIHRDLKPGNVLVSRHGDVKLCDFGLAMWMDRHQPLRGWLEGTPEHMAPEQALGAPVTAATDRWAFAALALEVLTGSRPYATQPNAARLLLEILERPPRRPRELGLSGDHLDRLFGRALARDPSVRPASCIELVSELDVALRTATRAVARPDEVACLPTQRVKYARRVA